MLPSLLHTQGSLCSLSGLRVWGAGAPHSSLEFSRSAQALCTGYEVGTVPWALHTPFFTGSSCVRERFLGCCSEKGFEVRLTWCFPKGTDSLCFSSGLGQPLSTAPNPREVKQNQEFTHPFPSAGRWQPQSQGDAGAFCTPRTRPDLLSQNPNTNHSGP